MDFNLLTNIEICHVFKNEAPMALVRYSHIPTAFISLLVGFFVYFKNRKSLIGKTLLAITMLFSMWSFFDLIPWEFGYNSVLTMFFWALLGLVQAFLFMSSLYLIYVFPENKDVSFTKKIIAAIFMLPVVLLTPTAFNLTLFDVTNCEATEGNFFTNYYYYLSLLIFLWILIIIFLKYRKSEKVFKKQILLMGSGIELFLILFFSTNFLATLLDNYVILIYGMFGMVIFMGFLAYMIVKFKAFDIKLIGAQALVYSLIILIGSQFFFIQSKTNQILTGITLTLAAVFGIFLIKSVKAEIKRKEELQDMTEKLAIANDQLRKLDNAKSEFISIASHQLRTPLTAIKGYASLILEGTYGEVNQGIAEPINKIYASNERLVQLVEELLNISKIESGKMEFNFEKHRIEDIVKDLSDTFVILAKDKKLYFNTELPEEHTPEVEIDTSKIREVISNLIDNSIKYTRRGGVNVKVELVKNATWKVKHQFKSEKPVIMDGDAVKITVSDTGIGIPKDDLSYLFSKFSRGRDTKRLHANGTGLGLYVGKNIIEAHHGKIWAESEGAEKGSRFIIELPLEQPKS